MRRTDGVKITFTVSQHTADVLDVLAFVKEVHGRSPRAQLIKNSVEHLANQAYRDDSTVQEWVDCKRAARERHPSGTVRHLHVVR